MSDNELVAMIVSMVCVTGAFVFVVHAFMNRFRRADPQARPDAATDHRLARIENAVEAIAIEVERIAEGQRFTSKLLAERAPAGAASAVSGANGSMKIEATHAR